MGLPAAACAAGSVYVTNEAGVSQFAIGAGGRLSPLSPASVAAGEYPLDVGVTPDGRRAYVTGDHSVFQYDVDPATGALSHKTPASVSAPAGTLSTFGIAVTPDNKRTYVTVSEPHGGSRVLQFDIDAITGALSLKTPDGVSTGFIPGMVAVAPDSKSAYVTSIFEGALQYDITPLTGALSPKTPPSVATGNYPEAVAVTPDGRSAYFINFNGSTPNNAVAQFSIDPVTGALSPKTPATVVTGPNASFIAISPDSRSAYVSSYGPPRAHGSGSVWQYDIDPASGALSPKSPPSVITDEGSLGVAVAPDNKSAYVANVDDKAVLQYDIDPASGVLAPKKPASIAAGTSPFNITVGPLPRVPTAKDQCKRGGWREFPQFKNQGQCVALVRRGLAQ